MHPINDDILDNRSATLAEYLRQHLPQAEIFRLVSAYFSVYGFASIADALETTPEVKFLFGDPSSAGETVSGDKEHIQINLHESGLSISDNILQQRILAEQCKKWVEKESVQIRTIAQSNFLHGKMYHLHSTTGAVAAAVGSSNFTRRGLGEAKTPNIELNIAVKSEETHTALMQWFDELWNDKTLTKDAKQELLDALARWHEEYSPELIYYKTLFELFSEELHHRETDAAQLDSSHLYDSEIWKALYEFQKDGAKSVIARLLRHNGCILADSVGLGKTYTALAVIKFFEQRNERVLVLCPKKLENNWRVYQASAGATDNPFIKDRFSYAQLAHTDLTREHGTSGSVNLANFNWDGFDLIVIDESHNFRNESKHRRNDEGNIIRQGRYEKLLEDVIKSGRKTKVLMLSATPVNNSLIDLRNQIYLMTEKRKDSFADTLGLHDINSTIGAAQRQFKEWEQSSKNRKKADLLEILGGDFLHLLNGITIARSRKQIKKFYTAHIEKYGDFPKRAKPINESPPTDTEGELSYKDMHGHISQAKFRIYRPSDYVIDEDVKQRLENDKEKYHFNQKDREHFLIAMIAINFLKRLESSAHSLKLTLERTIEKIDKQTKQIDSYLQTQENQELDDDTPLDDDENDGDGEFIINKKAIKPYRLKELDVMPWRSDIKEDREALQQALDLVNKITPERDNKLKKLQKFIKNKAKQTNRKLLIFTAFKDTANYLYENLAEDAKQLNINIAMVAGDETRTSVGRNSFNDILNNFAPIARRLGDKATEEQIDIIIATDCISEGQNLQDCDTVLNYDIHWNPVRLIQRFGRIDRIGSKNESVHMINFWPTDDMDFYLKLETRVRARMALVDATATGDDNSLDETSFDEAQAEINFRDRQMEELRKEVVDLEDLPDSISMSDLTLDYFLTQLLRYLEKHKDALEKIPAGAYAVADIANAKAFSDSTRPGVIFFFRQHGASANRTNNPTHPFYFVHVEKDGIRHGYMKAGNIMRLFEALALGKDTPHNRLCDAFTREIYTEEGNAYYNNMAKKAIDHIHTAFNSNSASALKMGGDKGALLPTQQQQPTVNNLELITWLVIKEHE